MPFAGEMNSDSNDRMYFKLYIVLDSDQNYATSKNEKKH